MARPPRQPRLPRDPDADWNASPLASADGLRLCDEIVEKIDDAPESVKDRAADFFESVREKVVSIRETIENTGRYSTGQRKALSNMSGGVDRWLENTHGEES